MAKWTNRRKREQRAQQQAELEAKLKAQRDYVYKHGGLTNVLCYEITRDIDTQMLTLLMEPYEQEKRERTLVKKLNKLSLFEAIVNRLEL